MPTHLSCTEGHRWPAPQANTLATGKPILCPQCGKPALLTDHSPTDKTVRNADFPAPPPPTPPDFPGYEVLGLLGEGGMGHVWRARDLKLNRLVALKVIAEGPIATATQRARFQIEAEALASLKHPNIVQIYDVNTHQNQSYLALELVEGGSLLSFIAGQPQDPRQAARLLRALSQAMHAAHLVGIVHRDLKPSNVLLQRRPAGNETGLDAFEPKISDFGIAKRLEQSDSHTRTGALLGTPAHMAPEQTLGDHRAVGPFTDVYALGIILYELLTGKKPFAGGSALETMQMVRDADPASPRQLRPGTPRDLEVICLKCLHKAPARRYASAEALAEDLRRFLDMEPIQAQPASWRERMLKWMRRRPTAAALTGVSIVALIAFVGLLYWSNRQLRAEADRADNAARHAQDRLKVAIDVVDDMYLHVTEDLLADEPHQDAALREFLEKAVKHYETFAAEAGADPDLQWRKGRAHARLGQTYRTLGQVDKAKDNYDKAIALLERLANEHAKAADYRRDLANACTGRGEWHRDRGDEVAAAEADYEKARHLQTELLKLSAHAAGDRLELARCEYNLGLVCQESRRLEKAKTHFDAAVATLDALHAQEPREPSFRQELGRSLINRGMAAAEGKDFKAAEADYRRALDLLTPRAGERRRVLVKRDLAAAHQNLGVVAYARGQYKEALKEVEPALTILRGLAADFPTRPLYQEKLARTLNVVGGARLKLGDRKAASEAFSEAGRLLDDIKPTPRHGLTLDDERGKVQGNLGLLEALEGRWDAARDLLEPAVETLTRVWKANADLIAVREALGENARSLAEVCLQLKDHARGAAAAQLMARVRPNGHQDDYYAACFLCRAASCAGADKTLPADKRMELQRQHKGDAADLLKRAGAGGKAVRRFAGDEGVLAPLLESPEYQAILAQFEAAPKE